MAPTDQAELSSRRRWIRRLAYKLWPELEGLSAHNRVAGTADVVGLLYGLPLALGGLAWLIAVTEPAVLSRAWPMLLLLLVLGVWFAEQKFYLVAEIQSGRYANSDGSLDGFVMWAGAFLFGPSAIWLGVASALIAYGRNWRQNRDRSGWWNWARNFSLSLAADTLGPLIALPLYQSWGGQLPIPGLGARQVLLALAALGVYFLVFWLIQSIYVAFVVRSQPQLSESRRTQPVLRFLVLALSLPLIASPAGILSAGIYQQNGLPGFLFLISGLLFVAVLARQLSLIVESSRQKTRQLEKLEELSRAIIQSPPDASILTEILAEHVPPMFPSGRIAIWVVPDRFLLLHPEDWAPTVDRFWAWMRDQTEPRALRARDEIPWAQGEGPHPPVIVTPIFAIETLKPVGGIYVELQDILQLWDARALEGLLPAVQSLAALIASTLREAHLYGELLDHQRVVQELRLAGQIQASFLPNEFPIPAGWELAVTILPARETSGDYFDLIPLTNGRLGILIADVADKGVGPALYMALSRTLIRTYAREFSLDPEVVFFAANGRILEDARANLFVTAFYGVLDPEQGTLTYSNAGHNPPFLISARDGGAVQPLDLPGIPIGIEAEAVWKKSQVHLNAGDMLVMYTDGIPDAQNASGELFGEGRLIEMARTCLGIPAQEAQANIINALQRFVGEAPQVDDITLMILARGEEPAE